MSEKLVMVIPDRLTRKVPRSVEGKNLQECYQRALGKKPVVASIPLGESYIRRALEIRGFEPVIGDKPKRRFPLITPPKD